MQKEPGALFMTEEGEKNRLRLVDYLFFISLSSDLTYMKYNF